MIVRRSLLVHTLTNTDQIGANELSVQLFRIATSNQIKGS